MGSSVVTSRSTAHTTDGTVLVPAGVAATSPLVGEMLPDVGEPVLLTGRPHAPAVSASAAAMAMVASRLRLQSTCPPAGTSGQPGRLREAPRSPQQCVVT